MASPCPGSMCECPDWCGGCDTQCYGAGGCLHCDNQAGCPDSMATNYNLGCPEGCVGCPDYYGEPIPYDTSCCNYPDVGCTDEAATNYDDDADVACEGEFPNSCCQYECQYNSDCTDIEYCNTNVTPNQCQENSDAVGCTDPAANNYCAECFIDLYDDCTYGGFPNYYNVDNQYVVQAREKYYGADNYSLQSSIATTFEGIEWPVPFFLNMQGETITINENTNYLFDTSFIINHNSQTGYSTDAFPILIAEFDDNFGPNGELLEGLTDNIFAGEVSGLYPSMVTTSEDLTTGQWGDGGIGVAPFDMTSQVIFDYKPYGNWNGTQTLRYRIRDIVGDKLYESANMGTLLDVDGEPIVLYGETTHNADLTGGPTSDCPKWNFSNNLEQPFKFTIWVMKPQGNFTLSIRNLEYPDEWIELGELNSPESINHGRFVAPFTFEINKNLVNNISNHARLYGGWEVSFWRNDGIEQGGFDAPFILGVYAYNISDADYLSDMRTVDFEVLPVPDGYEYTIEDLGTLNGFSPVTADPVETYNYNEDIYVPAYKPDSVTDFSVFANQFCTTDTGEITSIECNNIYLQQQDVSMQSIEAGALPEGQYIPTDENNPLRFEYVHDSQPITSKIHMTITVRDALGTNGDGNISDVTGKVKLNGIAALNSINSSLAFGNNGLNNNSLQGPIHTQTLEWDSVDEYGVSILNEGLNVIEIFDTSATVIVESSTCEDCEMGPTNSTTACCNNYDTQSGTECMEYWTDYGYSEIDSWDSYCCEASCSGNCTVCEDYEHAGAQLLKYTLWQESTSCEGSQTCTGYGSIQDVDVVPNLTSDEYSDFHALRCIDNKLCNSDSRNTLTRLGLIHYDYYLRFNELLMDNILYPNERIEGVLVQGSVGDYKSFKEGWEENPYREYVIQGFRDSDNRCCTPYGDYPDFDCIESLQTRFRLNDVGLHLHNYVGNSTNDSIYPDNIAEGDSSPYEGQCNSGVYNESEWPNYDSSIPNTPNEAWFDGMHLSVGWSSGRNCYTGNIDAPGQDWRTGTVNQGNHAKVIKDSEICPNDYCVEMKDENITYEIVEPNWTPETQTNLNDSQMSFNESTQKWEASNVHRWLGIHYKLFEDINELEGLFEQGQLVTISVWVMTKANADTQEELPTKPPRIGLYHLWNKEGTWTKGWGFYDSQDPQGSDENGINPATGKKYQTYSLGYTEPNTQWDIWEKREYTFEIDDTWNPNSWGYLYLYGEYGQDYSNIYYSNAQVTLGPEPGFSFQDDLEIPPNEKYYYQHFALDVNILNSPLQFCHGDKIIKNTALGFDSQAYDFIVSPQPNVLQVPVQISRNYIKDGVTYLPGQSPDININSGDPLWDGGVNHQNFGILEGIIIKTNDLWYNPSSPPSLLPDTDIDDAGNFDFGQAAHSTDTHTGFKDYWVESGANSIDHLDNPFQLSDGGGREKNLGLFLSNIHHNHNNLSFTEVNTGGGTPDGNGNTSIDTSFQNWFENFHRIPYWVVPFNYQGQTDDNNEFVFSSFIFDTPSCILDYTSPAPLHKVRVHSGNLSGETRRPMTSGLWKDIPDDYFIGKQNMGSSTDGMIYKPIDERINFGVQIGRYADRDERIHNFSSALYNQNDLCSIYNFPTNSTTQTYIAHTVKDGNSSCDGSSSPCSGNYENSKDGWDSRNIPAWDKKQQYSSDTMVFDTCTGGGCRNDRGLIQLSNHIGPVRYKGHSDYDGYGPWTWWLTPYDHSPQYHSDSDPSWDLRDYGNSQGTVNIDKTGFYHAPLPITLKYFKDTKNDTTVVDITPQPIDNQEQFPASQPFTVTMSIYDRADVLQTLWSDSDKNYPRESETLTDYIIEQLGVKNDDPLLDTHQTLEYKVKINSRPDISHRFSKKYFDTAFDGVSRVLPFYKEGLPFYVDDVFKGSAKVAFDLVKHMGISSNFEGSEDVEYYKSFTQDIKLLDANEPKFTSVRYSSEHHAQTGVQLGELITYYNFTDTTTGLIHPSYVNENSTGVYAIGSISFNSYELGENPAIPTYITTQDNQGNIINISEIFTIEESNIAQRVVDAINTGFEGQQTHQATLVENLSSDTEGSNLQIVEVKSLYLGKEYNKALLWSVQNNQLQSQPTFNNLINGETIITIDVYEDFNYFDLELIAGDIDPLTTITFKVDTANENIISGSVQSFVPASGTNTGDTIYQGGDEIVNLSAGEAQAIAVVRLSTYPNTTVDHATLLTYSWEDIEDPNIETPYIPLQPHYNGELDFVIRAVDNTTMFDEIKFRLIIHPVNDPPMFEMIGDKDVYMNNSNYPTMLSIPIRTNDIEEGWGAPIINTVDQIDETYCQLVLEEIVKIEGATGTYTNPTNGDTYDIGCTDRNQCRWYCLPDNPDLQCDFADFNNDNIINTIDYDSCLEAIPNNNVNLTTLQISNIPYWVKPDRAASNGYTYQELLDGTDGTDVVPQMDFINVVPEEDSIGEAKFRVQATDYGFNENYEIDEMRTGFTTASIEVKELSQEGPAGGILGISYASLGVKPDTYLYTAQGEDTVESRPTELVQEFKMGYAKFHDLENKSLVANYSVDNPYNTNINCGNLQYIDSTSGLPDPGFIGAKGFCCSTIPVPDDGYLNSLWINKYWNDERTYYYGGDWYDAVEDYRKFIDLINYNSTDNICSYELLENQRGFNTNTYQVTENAGGFVAPNSIINPLDYTKNYRLEIEDLVNSYDTAELIQSSSGINWTEYFDGFEDFGNGINEPWADKWNALSQEGWETGGSTNNDWGKVIYKTPTLDATTNANRILEEGYVYRYGKPSIYLVTVYSEDSYGYMGTATEIVDARDLVKMNQTLLNQYDPWQGINITGSDPVQNQIAHIESRDIDKRESLGLYYYDDLNYVDDWGLKYGNSYRGKEGNWTNSFPVEYYYGEVFNKIQFSQAFDNRFKRASVGGFFTEEKNGTIFYTIMKTAFPDFVWPSVSGDLEEEIEEEIEAIAAEVKMELGISGATIFNAWASGQLEEEVLPVAIQSLVDRIEALLTEPLQPSSEWVYSLEEESDVTSEYVYNNICKVTEEGSTGTLSCPQGATIKKVVFDSYGLPVGDCGIYSVNTDCHCAADTSTWIGKRSVTVDANNTLCGDPCSGVDKYRYVEVMCGFDRYDRWYKGGKSYGSDYQSNIDGIHVLANKTPAPNKVIQDVDEPNIGYFVHQSDMWSDYYGRYVCDIDSSAAYWHETYPWNLAGNAELSYDIHNRQQHFLSDSFSECNYNCYINLYTDLSGNEYSCAMTKSPSTTCGTDTEDDSGSSYNSSCFKCDTRTYTNYNDKQNFLNSCSNCSCSTETSYDDEDDTGNTYYSCSYHCYQYKCNENGHKAVNKNQSVAAQACELNCYKKYSHHPDTNQPFCQELESDNVASLYQAGVINPYFFHLGQNKLVETNEKVRTDRIVSVYMRPWLNMSPDNIGGETYISPDYRDEPEASLIQLQSILSGTPQDGIHIGNTVHGTTEDVDLWHSGYYNYGYSVQLPIRWEEVSNGTSIWTNPDYHPEYEDIPLWGVEEINIDPTGAMGQTSMWYRFWVRVLHDELVDEYKFRISPNFRELTNDEEGAVYLYGASIQEIPPYEKIQNPYQKTRFPGEIGMWDFVPDVDVRTIKSADGWKSVLTEYYDSTLQPGKYSETSAPLTAQLYFYIRNAIDKTIFVPKDIQQYPNNSLYVGFIDWGDGSKMEYEKEPYELNESKIITHTYEDSGIYQVTGEIFNIARDISGEVLGIGHFYTFKLNLNVNINKEIEGEFQVLGGEKYTFLPYQKTFPVIGGVSDGSIYKKIIKRTLGFVGDGDNKYVINTKFKFIGDKIKSEQALVTVDERYVGKTLSAYTGSYPTQSGLIDSDTVEIYGGSDACIESVSESGSLFTCTSTNEVFESRYVCSENCIDLEEAKYAAGGFYQGNVDNTTGQLVSSGSTYTDEDGIERINTIIPKLINTGFDIYPEELGNYLGDTDIAQTRYFDRPIDMWEMIGFPCLDTLEESRINYLTNNMIELWTLTNPDIVSLVPSNNIPVALENYLFESFILRESGEYDNNQGIFKITTVTSDSIAGKTYTFSIYLKRSQGFNLDIPINVAMYSGNGVNTPDEEKVVESFQIGNGWERVSITITFPEELATDIVTDITTIIYDNEPNTAEIDLIGPQLEKGQLTPYLSPTNPVLEGSCTDAPGGNPGNEKYYKNIIPKDFDLTDREGFYFISKDPNYNSTHPMIGPVMWTTNETTVNTENIPSELKAIISSDGHGAHFVNGMWVGSLQSLVYGITYTYTLWNNESFEWVFEDEIVFSYVKSDGDDTIDENSSQDWIGTNEWGVNYYYPVVTKLNKFGEAVDIIQSGSNGLNKTPYGSIDRKWDGIDETAPVSLIEINKNKNYIDDCLLDLNYGSIGDGYLEDLSGNTNLGIFIGDYKVTFNTITNKPKKTGSFKNMVLGQKDKQKAF